MIFRRTVFALPLALAPLPALAAPFFVGGATVGQDRKAKLHLEATDSNHLVSMVLPKVGISLPVSQDLEIGFEAQHNTIRRSGGHYSHGIGDPELKAKLALSRAAESPLGIDLAAELKAKAPIGDQSRGLGAGSPSIEGVLLAGISSGANEFGAKLGYVRVTSQSSGKTLFGLLAARKLSPRLLVGAELATEMRDLNHRNYDLSANLGAKLKTGDRLEWHLLFGRSVACGKQNLPISRIKFGVDFKL